MGQNDENRLCTKIRSKREEAKAKGMESRSEEEGEENEERNEDEIVAAQPGTINQCVCVCVTENSGGVGRTKCASPKTVRI